MPEPNRRSLYKNASLSMPGSDGVIFGTFNTVQYSRITGFVSIQGSATFRVRSGVSSGTYQITSATTVNSGLFTFDQQIYGSVTEIGLTPASSQTAAVIVAGDMGR